MTEPSSSESEMDKSSSTVREAAERISGVRTPLITDKEITPPSGDKRDFVSISPYFWRNEEGGFDYKDGQRNPKEKDHPDSENLVKAIGNILVTSLATERTQDPEEQKRYADYSVSVLNAWFVDEETRMSPSFEFAQMREGETTGNWYGIIEGQRLVHVIDAVNCLEEKGFIDQDTLKGVEKWFSEYLSWLQESKKGELAREALNNHGTFYDVQIAFIADFLGKKDLVLSTIERTKERIGSQIGPDGSMPREVERTLPYDYQLYNLFAFSELAVLGNKYGVDLWGWESEDGRGLKKAFEYFAGQLSRFEGNPFKMNRSGELYLAFRAAARVFDNVDYWGLPAKYYEDSLADEISMRKFNRPNP